MQGALPPVSRALGAALGTHISLPLAACKLLLSHSAEQGRGSQRGGRDAWQGVAGQRRAHGDTIAGQWRAHGYAVARQWQGRAGAGQAALQAGVVRQRLVLASAELAAPGAAARAGAARAAGGHGQDHSIEGVDDGGRLAAAQVASNCGSAGEEGGRTGAGGGSAAPAGPAAAAAGGRTYVGPARGALQADRAVSRPAHRQAQALALQGARGTGQAAQGSAAQYRRVGC